MSIDLRNAAVGDRVQHEFLVRSRTERVTRANKPFVVLSLSNASGSIDSAPIWDEQMEWCAGAVEGSVVQVIGEISTYGDDASRRRQLTITAPLRVLPPGDYNPEHFLERVEYSTESMWSSIDKMRGEFRSEKLRSAVDLFFADDEFRVEFERTPGSVRGHHAKLGGLLLHVWEVASIARHTARTVKHANQDLVVAGALLHDIGKVQAYSISPKGFDHTTVGMLLGHVTLGALMFDRRLTASKLSLSSTQHNELLHMILSHHGSLEFGSPVQPMTAEAEIVHWADEASAKATDMIDEQSDSDLFPAGGTNDISLKRSWKLGRRLWRRSETWD